MKSLTTTLMLGLFLAGTCITAFAQPVRNGVDAVWARDIDGAEIIFDGALDEDVWQQAETITIQREMFYEPGGGWQDFTGFTIEEPTDPVDATIYFLRDGNTLWIGVDAADKSIGGTQDFFQHDGLVMSILDKRNREAIYDGVSWFNGSNTDEFFYSWLNRGPDGAFEPDSVGIDPLFFGNEVVDGVPNEDVWDARAVVDGVSNDDTNGTGEPTEDVGYTMEVMLNLETLGFDMTDADGDRLPMTLGIYDFDYRWPNDPDLNFRSRAWWQNPWGGDMPYGVGFVYGSPDVTVNSGETPEITEPELLIPKTGDATVVTVDGQLDEAIWERVDPQVTIQYQMSEEMLDALPGYGPWYTHWFCPGCDAEGAPPVIDPSTGQIRMFYQGSTLYVGLDSDDQAISGQVGVFDRNDGIRFAIRQLEDAEGGPVLYPSVGFRVVVDSSGTATLLDGAQGEDGGPAPGVEAAVYLKEGSTAGDPSDVDAGYQIELAIDLEEVFGYPSNLDGEEIYVGAAYLDGDDLDPAENSYGTRTWWLIENPGDFGGPAALAFLDASQVVAVDDGPGEVPRQIALLGNYPNPFNPSTTLRYALPQTGDVRIHVFDVLGREVALLTPGTQNAGANTYTFDATGLASGMYLYRVDLIQAGSIQSSATGRMTLLK